MEEINNSLKIYSEEVRDVLSSPPKAIQKWGNSILLLFIIVLFLISWFVKYPDIITSQVVITTNMPPQKVVVNISGKIDAILVKDKEIVKPNAVLAVLENSARSQDIFLLKNILDTINIEKVKFPFAKFNSAQLGDVESSFANFRKESLADELNLRLKPYRVEDIAQRYEANQLQERLSLLQSQKDINQNELLLQKNDLDRYELLFIKGIYSSQEVEKQRLIYLQAQKGYNTFLSTISQLKSSLNELRRNNQTTHINESKEEINLENNKMQAFFQLKKALRDWELNYILKSSINGKISFLQIWSENQFVEVGSAVFAIVPILEKDYIGKLKAPALNSGKIKKGQFVNIRLTNFPDNQFGMLTGKVNNISLTPDKDGNLWIDVLLPKKLETSYHKRIPFKQEMSGSAEIVTEDLRLIERLLYQFRDIFKR
ncbi:MAG: HlyD family efflux transporter periplasmic adaptor subunit [Flavobacterium sp.]|uniref:HlyD family secretion protein n=1 Tax=Flavobacterium sp. TaxID=239 RepID=UPI001B0BF952|nr:HlyD family efflux transporter periplasmic adaptor subunit [Flavobacterium sp.]MBO9582926.1 HlyD family efflux transporter periplasmic adaptor subunit [Flavobacterium sp.]